jgi:hypothetical protein
VTALDERLSDAAIAVVYDELAAQVHGWRFWEDLDDHEHAVITLMRDLLIHRIRHVDPPLAIDLVTATEAAAKALGYFNRITRRSHLSIELMALANALIEAAR